MHHRGAEKVRHAWPLLLTIPGVTTNWFLYLNQPLLDFTEKGLTYGQPIAKAFIMQDPRAIADDYSTFNQQRSNMLPPLRPHGM